MQSELIRLEQQHLLRQRVEVQRLPGGYALKNGRRLVNFSDNDYLGLSFHPEVMQTAQAAIAEYGAGAGASRLVTGNHPLYTLLERELAEYKGCEDALVFGSGFLVNHGVITALIGAEDFILADRLIHASLVDAIRLSGATFQRYRHNDVAHLRQLLQKAKKRCWIVTESVFSMDGDLAPLAEIQALAEEFDAQIIVDDAHGFGVIPLSVNSKRVIQTGTFSKAAGSYGGYVCATREVIALLVNKARSLIYTTGLPPSVIAANLAALRIIRNQPKLSALPLQQARLFDAKAQSAIVPLIVGSDQAALEASKVLEDEGFIVAAIRPPTVAVGTSRLRFAFSAVHRREDIERLIAVLSALSLR